MMGRTKKVETVEQPVEVEEAVRPNNGVEVTVHQDRWDGTVNTNVAPELPSLNDPGQS